MQGVLGQLAVKFLKAAGAGMVDDPLQPSGLLGPVTVELYSSMKGKDKWCAK